MSSDRGDDILSGDIAGDSPPPSQLTLGDALFQAAFEGVVFVLIMTAGNLAFREWYSPERNESLGPLVMVAMLPLLGYVPMRVFLAMRGPRIYRDRDLAARGRMNMLLAASIIVLATVLVRMVASGLALTAELVGPLIVAAALGGFAIVQLRGMRQKVPVRVIRQAAIIGLIGSVIMAVAGAGLLLGGTRRSAAILILACSCIMMASSLYQWRNARVKSREDTST